ncbi:MAG: AMMECR1 domain-containing protein, partial [Chloroflexota bacterium]
MVLMADEQVHPVVRLAKETVETYVREGRVPGAGERSPEMEQRAGVFVSLHKHGQLRGCIG